MFNKAEFRFFENKKLKGIYEGVEGNSGDVINGEKGIMINYSSCTLLSSNPEVAIFEVRDSRMYKRRRNVDVTAFNSPAH